MSASEDPDDISSISWPGFVDIMSSVIMMFIFFVLITSVALYFHTITYKSKVMSQISSLAQKSVEQQTKAIVKENQKVKEENQALRKQIAEVEDKTKKADSKFAQSKDQSVTAEPTGDKMVIFFGGDSISLTEDTKTKYNDFVKAYLDKNKNHANIYAEIIAAKEVTNDNESFAQEIATARTLNARNILLNTEIPKDHISVSIEKGEPIQDKHDWVTIRFYQK